MRERITLLFIYNEIIYIYIRVGRITIEIYDHLWHIVLIFFWNYVIR